jgi:hypothetical protein
MSKITAYGQLTAPAADDVLPVVDVSDTSMAATGTTKKVRVGDLLAGTDAAGAAAMALSAAEAYTDARAGGRSFSQPFTVASQVTVTHGLGRYPAVTVIDSAGDLIEGEIGYLSPDSLTVSFSAPFSGVVTCN